MNKPVVPEKPVIGAHAWRITFDDTEKEHPAGTIIREPRYAAAEAHPISVDAAFADAADANDTSLLVMWLPTGEPAPTDLESNVELWISRCAPDRPAVRATIRTVRVVWARTRAIVYAAPEQWPETLDAILRFTLMARETSDLEQQMPSLWAAVKEHTPLSHAVSFRQHRQLPQVKKMTEVVTGMKMSFLRMQSAVEQSDLRLSSASKRLCAELILQAAIHDRLEGLEGPIQFALDHYELANTRLIEHKTASIETILMALIVLALVLQTGVMLVQEIPRLLF